MQGLTGAELNGKSLSVKCNSYANGSTFTQLVGQYMTQLNPRHITPRDREFSVTFNDDSAMIYKKGNPFIQVRQRGSAIVLDHLVWTAEATDERCRRLCSALEINLKRS